MAAGQMPKSLAFCASTAICSADSGSGLGSLRFEVGTL
jgi:hypothetical protein